MDKSSRLERLLSPGWTSTCLFWRTSTELLLLAAAAYAGCGLLFAIPFVLKGAGKIDAHAAHATFGFRLLILPGSVFLWPFLARRWLQASQKRSEP